MENSENEGLSNPNRGRKCFQSKTSTATEVRLAKDHPCQPTKLSPIGDKRRPEGHSRRDVGREDEQEKTHMRSYQTIKGWAIPPEMGKAAQHLQGRGYTDMHKSKGRPRAYIPRQSGARVHLAATPTKPAEGPKIMPPEPGHQEMCPAHQTAHELPAIKC